MKNALKIILLALVVVSATATVKAQQIKLGYISSQDLIMAMPERDSAQVKFEAYALELQDQLELLQVEFNTKYQKFQKEVNTYSEAIREMKAKELNDLNTRMQESQQVAEQDLQRMQGDLYTPIFEKADEAIKKVAKANGITAVFEASQGAMLYFDENTMIDLLPLVKKELGIQ